MGSICAKISVVSGSFTNPMKPFRLLLCSVLVLFVTSVHVRAAEEKKTADKAKDLLDKALGEINKAANKVETKSKQLWERTKETLRLSKDEYLKKATSGLATIDAEIQGIAESGAGVLSRDYYKTRLDALKLHLEYCKRELAKLKDTDTEEAFRVRQKGFDRTLGALGDNVEVAKDEAGL